MKKTSVWPPTSMHLVVCYKGFGIEKEKNGQSKAGKRCDIQTTKRCVVEKSGREKESRALVLDG